MVISRTVSRPFRRRPEYAFPGSETSKYGHIANGNPVVSYLGRRIFHVPKRRKNGHFANGKPPVYPVTRKRFLRLRNVQKWSLHERETGRFLFRRNFFRYRNVGKMSFWERYGGHFAGGENKLSQAPKRPKTVTSRTETGPFPFSGGKFSGDETSEKWSFRER